MAEGVVPAPAIAIVRVAVSPTAVQSIIAEPTSKRIDSIASIERVVALLSEDPAVRNAVTATAVVLVARTALELEIPAVITLDVIVAGTAGDVVGISLSEANILCSPTDRCCSRLRYR